MSEKRSDQGIRTTEDQTPQSSTPSPNQLKGNDGETIEEKEADRMETSFAFAGFWDSIEESAGTSNRHDVPSYMVLQKEHPEDLQLKISELKRKVEIQTHQIHSYAERNTELTERLHKVESENSRLKRSLQFRVNNNSL